MNVLKQALEALDLCQQDQMYYEARKSAQLACSSLRAAIAQAEQERPITILSGYQLRDALELIAPDMTDEQLEQQVCIQHGPARTHDDGTEPEGLYCWLDEYPEEGSISLEPPHQPAKQEPARELVVITEGTAAAYLHDLCEALNNAFISTWQSTHAWQKQLDAANEYLVSLVSHYEMAVINAKQLGQEQAAPGAVVEGWQPIETAPKDMAARIYRVNGYAIQGFVDAAGIYNVQNERGEWRKMRGIPTHWMPLPAAPSAPKPQGE